MGDLKESQDKVVEKTEDGEILTESEVEAQKEYDKAYEDDKLEPDHPEDIVTDPPTGEKSDKSDEDKKGEQDPPDKKPDELDTKGKPHGDEESLTKALNDTKSLVEKQALEIKTQKEIIEKHGIGEATAKEAEDAKAALAIAEESFDKDLKEFYEEYPEAEKVMTPLVNALKMQAKDVAKLSESNKINEGAKEFQEKILPKVVELGHTDAEAMIYDPRYKNWAVNTAPPGVGQMALQSSDPQDIHFAITEFKKFIATPEGEKLKEEQDKVKDKIIEQSQTLRSGGEVRLGKKKSKDMDDYDAGWNESEKELEGIV